MVKDQTYTTFSLESGEVTGLLNNLKTIATGLISADKAIHGSSLTDALGVATLSPICIVSKTCSVLDNLPDITSFALTVFAERYCQAVSLYGARVNGMRVIKLLDKFNPNRKLSDAFLSLESKADHVFNNRENYHHQLPSLEDVENYSIKDVTPKEASASVGKRMEITIGAGKETATVTVNARLYVNIIEDELSTAILSKQTHRPSFSELFRKSWNGERRWIKDFIFWQDSIEKEKRLMMLDDKGIYRKIVKRATTNKKAGAISQNISLNTHSNVYIIDETTAKNAEIELGGPLTVQSIRDRVFQDSYAMMIIIVDRDWENITVYLKGDDVGATVTWKELKKTKKNPNILDLLEQKNIGGSLI